MAQAQLTDNGFCFALVLEGGVPADPAGFVTVIPTWRVGDEFLAGERLRRFRILGIVHLDEVRETFAAFWLVEPVD